MCHISANSFKKLKMWKFSYSFRNMAIFYFIDLIVAAAKTIEGGKLFKGGNDSWKYVKLKEKLICE